MLMERHTCPSCGAPVGIGAKSITYCAYCGTRLQVVDEPEQPPKVAEQLKKLNNQLKILQEKQRRDGTLRVEEQREFEGLERLTGELKTIGDWISDEVQHARMLIDDDPDAEGKTIYYVCMTNHSGINLSYFSIEASYETVKGHREKVLLIADDWGNNEEKELPFHSRIPAEDSEGTFRMDVMSARYRRA